jgi:hypothetical protein
MNDMASIKKMRPWPAPAGTGFVGWVAGFSGDGAAADFFREGKP